MLPPAMVLRPIAQAPLALGTVGDEAGDRFATPRMTPPSALRHGDRRASWALLDGRLVGSAWPSRGARPRMDCHVGQDPIADDGKSGKRTVDSATDPRTIAAPAQGAAAHDVAAAGRLAGGFGG